MNARDPVHFFEGDAQEVRGWYFWIETWHDRYGPYDTEAEAREKLARYCDEVLG